jgi:hypothetical protein
MPSIFAHQSFALRQILLVCAKRPYQKTTENSGFNPPIPGVVSKMRTHTYGIIRFVGQPWR